SRKMPVAHQVLPDPGWTAPVLAAPPAAGCPPAQAPAPARPVRFRTLLSGADTGRASPPAPVDRASLPPPAAASDNAHAAGQEHAAPRRDLPEAPHPCAPTSPPALPDDAVRGPPGAHPATVVRGWKLRVPDLQGLR